MIFFLLLSWAVRASLSPCLPLQVPDGIVWEFACVSLFTDKRKESGTRRRREEEYGNLLHLHVVWFAGSGRRHISPFMHWKCPWHSTLQWDLPQTVSVGKATMDASLVQHSKGHRPFLSAQQATQIFSSTGVAEWWNWCTANMTEFLV